MAINALRKSGDLAPQVVLGADAGLETGVVPVPAKPTAAMLAAGARAGGVTVEVAWKVYRAMIRTTG